MKKYVATFLLGAAVGGTSTSLAFRPDKETTTFKPKFREVNELEQKKSSVPSPYDRDANRRGAGHQNRPIKEFKEGSRFIERNRRTPSWENFDIHASQLWDFNWDRRHFDEYQEVESDTSLNESNGNKENGTLRIRPTGSRHLILVRHGQYNLDGQTDQERSLTELGYEQARLTGQRLGSLNLPLTHVVSSTMTRAKETKDIMRPFLPPELPCLPNDPILCEGAPFPPEPDVGTKKAELFYHRDGARIEAAFRKYFHRADPDQEQDSFEVVVCHANVIRYFVCRALQLPPEAWLRISLKHASITWVTIRPDGRTSIRALGEAGFMPPNKLTTTQTVTPF